MDTKKIVKTALKAGLTVEERRGKLLIAYPQLRL